MQRFPDYSAQRSEKRVTSAIIDGLGHPCACQCLLAARLSYGWIGRTGSVIQVIGTPSVNIDPDIRSLRDDPRYKAFLRKMSLSG
jgi:hypothetical protein